MLIQGRVKKGTVPLKSYILSRHLLSVFGEAGVKRVGTGGGSLKERSYREISHE